jgi:hypothetical protein
MLKISESLFDVPEPGEVPQAKVKAVTDRIMAKYRRRKSEKGQLAIDGSPDSFSPIGPVAAEKKANS